MTSARNDRQTISKASVRSGWERPRVAVARICLRVPAGSSIPTATTRAFSELSARTRRKIARMQALLARGAHQRSPALTPRKSKSGSGAGAATIVPRRKRRATARSGACARARAPRGGGADARTSEAAWEHAAVRGGPRRPTHVWRRRGRHARTLSGTVALPQPPVPLRGSAFAPCFGGITSAGAFTPSLREIVLFRSRSRGKLPMAGRKVVVAIPPPALTRISE
ncbi:hypothetical protein BD413DRAFT_505145 [Trametes elegans]|nr:hypothetical protein BD413DRAFT_505145 [Trametes elegans]